MTGQLIKLFWLLPFFLTAAVLSFIPLLLPLGILLGAWLLAFQFIDAVLDVLLIRPGSRVGFGMKHVAPLLVFGGVLTFLWAIPFLGILLAPAAAAAAAWLLCDDTLYTELEHLPRRRPSL